MSSCTGSGTLAWEVSCTDPPWFHCTGGMVPRPSAASPPVPVPLWHAFSIPDSFKRLVKCFGSNPKPNGPLICPRAASAIQCQVGLGGMVRE